MARSTDQLQVIPAARRLRGLGAERGAFQMLVNAAAQRQAAEVRDLTQWTPAGAVPLQVRKPAEHFNPANDHLPDPSSTTA